MRDYRSLTYAIWYLQSHIVFIPKRRKKMIFEVIRKHLRKVRYRLHRDLWGKREVSQGRVSGRAAIMYWLRIR